MKKLVTMISTKGKSKEQIKKEVLEHLRLKGIVVHKKKSQ